jgi:hypothetical protein
VAACRLTGHGLGEDADAEVVVGIETDRGPWVQALSGAGYTDPAAFAAQRAIVDLVFVSEDAREGALAFAERLAPRWRGR